MPEAHHVDGEHSVLVSQLLDAFEPLCQSNLSKQNCNDKLAEISQRQQLGLLASHFLVAVKSIREKQYRHKNGYINRKKLFCVLALQLPDTAVPCCDSTTETNKQQKTKKRTKNLVHKRSLDPPNRMRRPLARLWKGPLARLPKRPLAPLETSVSSYHSPWKIQFRLHSTQSTLTVS